MVFPMSEVRVPLTGDMFVPGREEGGLVQMEKFFAAASPAASVCLIEETYAIWKTNLP